MIRGSAIDRKAEKKFFKPVSDGEVQSQMKDAFRNRQQALVQKKKPQRLSAWQKVQALFRAKQLYGAEDVAASADEASAEGGKQDVEAAKQQIAQALAKAAEGDELSRLLEEVWTAAEDVKAEVEEEEEAAGSSEDEHSSRWSESYESSSGSSSPSVASTQWDKTAKLTAETNLTGPSSPQAKRSKPLHENWRTAKLRSLFTPGIAATRKAAVTFTYTVIVPWEEEALGTYNTQKARKVRLNSDGTWLIEFADKSLMDRVKDEWLITVPDLTTRAPKPDMTSKGLVQHVQQRSFFRGWGLSGKTQPSECESQETIVKQQRKESDFDEVWKQRRLKRQQLSDKYLDDEVDAMVDWWFDRVEEGLPRNKKLTDQGKISEAKRKVTKDCMRDVNSFVAFHSGSSNSKLPAEEKTWYEEERKKRAQEETEDTQQRVRDLATRALLRSFPIQDSSESDREAGTGHTRKKAMKAKARAKAHSAKLHQEKCQTQCSRKSRITRGKRVSPNTEEQSLEAADSLRGSLIELASKEDDAMHPRPADDLKQQSRSGDSQRGKNTRNDSPTNEAKKAKSRAGSSPGGNKVKTDVRQGTQPKEKAKSRAGSSPGGNKMKTDVRQGTQPKVVRAPSTSSGRQHQKDPQRLGSAKSQQLRTKTNAPLLRSASAPDCSVDGSPRRQKIRRPQSTPSPGLSADVSASTKSWSDTPWRPAKTSSMPMNVSAFKTSLQLRASETSVCTNRC